MLSMLHEPESRHKQVNAQLIEFHRSENKNTRCPLKRSTLSSLLPIPKKMPLNLMYNQASHTLGTLDYQPQNEKEDANMELLGIILERYFDEDFPLDILLLIEEEWSQKYEVWKSLREARNVTSLRK